MSYTERFQQYFSREVAERAAQSLTSGAEIEFQISSDPQESFTFTRAGGHSQIARGPAKDPQLRFEMTPAAADAILADPSEDVGEIGVRIAKMVVSPDADQRVSIRILCGFLTLFSLGYFGVVTQGGTAFASYLASRGLGGMGAIKSALKRARGPKE